jgi:hypothetical protein
MDAGIPSRSSAAAGAARDDARARARIGDTRAAARPLGRSWCGRPHARYSGRGRPGASPRRASPSPTASGLASPPALLAAARGRRATRRRRVATALGQRLVSAASCARPPARPASRRVRLLEAEHGQEGVIDRSQLVVDEQASSVAPPGCCNSRIAIARRPSLAAVARPLLFVRLSSERARHAVRQDCSLLKKQESPPALLVVIRDGRARLDRRCARSRWNAQVPGCPVPLPHRAVRRAGLRPADHAAPRPYVRAPRVPPKARRARRVAV